MPYKIRKKRGHDCYKVTNIETGKVMAECATKENAKEQVRLLENIDKEDKQPVRIHTAKTNISDEEVEDIDKTKEIIKK